SFGAYVVTDDPDGVHDRAVKAGAEIIMELHETDYGSRDFAARDPEGNRWSFGTYRGAPRKSGWPLTPAGEQITGSRSRDRPDYEGWVPGSTRFPRGDWPSSQRWQPFPAAS